MSPSTSHKQVSFADAMSVKATSPHTYEADFPEDWCIGSVPHGGYITAVFQTVASTHFKTTLKAQNQPHTIALHLDFLRRTQKGPALFTVKDTKLGRQTSVIHITLSQISGSSSREEVFCSLTQSNMASEHGVSIPTHYKLQPPPPALPINFALLKSNKDKNWVKTGEGPHTEFRKATAKAETYLPVSNKEQKGYSEQWMRLKNGERWTNEMMGYVVDIFAVPVERNLDLEAAAPSLTTKSTPSTNSNSNSSSYKPCPDFWYPTVLLNLDVKKSLPEEGVEWLFTRTSAKVIKNGRMDLEFVVLDEAGEIVALSHHVALAVGRERNTGVRGGGESKI
ncbi:uncharacterized protein RCO7_06114 [Rhynchosporium graminicola]|uniref:Thioesterase family protein n=1 Tax=Rhynchosporium graminicola TaxID=2792576 RepID=A0A1E1KZ32_9HELO|nr:uncharacterized protein RCO7_06114 [Rhynchosporium commune]